jgi:hypothetical protein
MSITPNEIALRPATSRAVETPDDPARCPHDSGALGRRGMIRFHRRRHDAILPGMRVHPDSSCRWEGTTAAARVFLYYIRHIPDHPLKLRIARRVNDRWFARAVPVVAPNGARVVVDFQDWMGRQIASHPSYEPATLFLAAELLSKGGVLFDVGACFGLFTCFLRVLPGVRCVAIEPAAESFLALRRNVSANPGVRAALYHVAVDSTARIADFSCPDPTNNGKNRVAVPGEDNAA